MEFVSPVPQIIFPKLQKEVEKSILTAPPKRVVFPFSSRASHKTN